MYECERCMEPAPKLPAPLPGRCMPKEELRRSATGRLGGPPAPIEARSKLGRTAWPSPGAGGMSGAGACPASAFSGPSSATSTIN